jgi:hypothetical protein
MVQGVVIDERGDVVAAGLPGSRLPGAAPHLTAAQTDTLHRLVHELVLEHQHAAATVSAFVDALPGDLASEQRSVLAFVVQALHKSNDALTEALRELELLQAAPTLPA